MRSAKGLSLMTVLLAVMVPSVWGAPAEGPLKVKLNPVNALGSRTGGPVPVQVTLDWAGRGLIEGNLQVTLSGYGQVLGRCESEDLALTPGTRTFRMLLPPVRTNSIGRGQVDVDMSFVGKNLQLHLQPGVMSLPFSGWHQFTICVSDPWGGGDRDIDVLARSLRVERFFKKDEKDRESLPVTIVVRTKPEDFPTNPLAYCCYDVIVLEGRGLKLLHEDQLKSLGEWVRAGGSMCVIPTESQDAQQVKFLNALSGKRSGPFALEHDGAVRVPEHAPADGINCFHTDMGRSVVITSGLGSINPDGESWRHAACFLWKIRRDVESQVISSGTAEATTDPGATRGYSMTNRIRGSNLEAGNFAGFLMPAKARLVPLWLIALMLMGFVVVIGPVDYFVLGALRMRKYTWVVFPSVSAAFALIMVCTTEATLGGSDHRASLVFVDVGQGGKTLKTNRYELIFAAGPENAVTQLENCAFMPMESLGVYNEYQYGAYRGPYGPSGNMEGEGEVPHYSGRVPSHYQVTQRIEKWRPQLNRMFSVEEPPVKPELDWDALDVSQLQAEKSPGVLLNKLTKGRPFNGNISFLRGDQKCFLSGERPEIGFGNGMPMGSRTLLTLETFAASASRGGNKPVFSMVSQLSPTWGGDIDDLALVDPQESGHVLLMAVMKVGNDYYVFRRLYCEEH